MTLHKFQIFILPCSLKGIIYLHHLSYLFPKTVIIPKIKLLMLTNYELKAYKNLNCIKINREIKFCNFSQNNYLYYYLYNLKLRICKQI